MWYCSSDIAHRASPLWYQINVPSRIWSTVSWKCRIYWIKNGRLSQPSHHTWIDPLFTSTYFFFWPKLNKNPQIKYFTYVSTLSKRYLSHKDLNKGQFNSIIQSPDQVSPDPLLPIFSFGHKFLHRTGPESRNESAETTFYQSTEKTLPDEYRWEGDFGALVFDLRRSRFGART